jgi:hypothetical protein
MTDNRTAMELHVLRRENAELRKLASILYALLKAPVPYTPAEVAERMAARDYVERRMAELRITEVDDER